MNTTPILKNQNLQNSIRFTILVQIENQNYYSKPQNSLLTGQETELLTHLVANRKVDPINSVVAETKQCVPNMASTPSQIPTNNLFYNYQASNCCIPFQQLMSTMLHTKLNTLQTRKQKEDDLSKSSLTRLWWNTSISRVPRNPRQAENPLLIINTVHVTIRKIYIF